MKGPFAGAFDGTEVQIKDQLLANVETTHQKISELVEQATAILDTLEKIHAVLGSIKKIAVEEVGDLSPDHILNALWELLAQPADKVYLHHSRKTLLADITRFYSAASSIVQDAMRALLHAQSELEAIDIRSANPLLLHQQYPIKVIAVLFRDSLQRLNAGRERFDDPGPAPTHL